MSVEWDTDMTKISALSIKDKDGKNVQTLALSVNGRGDFAVFPNNTMWIGIKEMSKISVVLIPLPKLLPEGE